jgi:hypothetical protein
MCARARARTKLRTPIRVSRGQGAFRCLPQGTVRRYRNLHDSFTQSLLHSHTPHLLPRYNLFLARHTNPRILDVKL